MSEKKPLLLKESKDKQQLIELHNRITFALFANMKRYIRMNKLANDLEINWRTVEKHLTLMTNGYRERNKTNIAKRIK